MPAENPTTEEIWKPVVGYEGWYEVSDMGRVRRIMKRGRGHASGDVPYVLKMPTSTMYPMVALSKNGVERKEYVHRLVATAFLGVCPPGKEVNHKNAAKFDARLSNLEYVTRRENHAHAAALGLSSSPPHYRGEKHPMAKFTASQIRKVRALAGRMSYDRMAAKFGMSRSQVSNILHRRHWTHI